MFEQLEIFYINLEHRVDRKIEIESELKKLTIFHYTRFNAIKASPGILGCTMSHHEVYKSASRKKPLFILEDDCEFLLSKREIENLIALFLKSKADVFCLGFNIAEKKWSSLLRQIRYNFFRVDLWPLIFGQLRRRAKIQTMSCYIIKPHMIETLIKVSESCITDLKNGKPAYEAALDQVWKRLQKKYVFVIPRIRAAKQRSSYSDIENENKNYGV